MVANAFSMDQVSVVIPTYNRFTYLLNTIQSIQNQSYQNVEIIVVNDCSTEKLYYEHDWDKQGVTILHLEKNSKMEFGYACVGYVRNKGIQISSGKYLAFCDDDDIWLPDKLELQVNAMKATGCKMSSTEGYFGNGVFDSSNNYPKYNDGYYFKQLTKIYKNHSKSTMQKFLGSIPLLNRAPIFESEHLLSNGFPDIWDFEFLSVHNCVIASSVVIDKETLDTIAGFRNVKTGEEDYDCWLRALKITNSVYVKEPCFYYDGGHGDGQNY